MTINLKRIINFLLALLCLIFIWLSTSSFTPETLVVECQDRFKIISNNSRGVPVELYVVELDTVFQCRFTGSSQNVNCTPKVRDLIMNSGYNVIWDDCLYLCTDSCRPNVAVVPVELSEFTAHLNTDKNEVELRWRTLSEFNNWKFVVEKSLDAISFSYVGSVLGWGTTNVPKSYMFLDTDVSAPLVYYRLVQIDYDGKLSYSPIVAVESYFSTKSLWYYALNGRLYHNLRNAPSGIYFNNNKETIWKP